MDGPRAGLGLTALSVTPLAALPPVRPGDDLAGLVAAAAPADLGDGDVLVLAHKVVSKAEGRIRRLDGIEPGERARELAASTTRTRGSCRPCSTSRRSC